VSGHGPTHLIGSHCGFPRQNAVDKIHPATDVLRTCIDKPEDTAMIRIWRTILRWWREAGTAATLHHLPDHVKRDIGLMGDDPILTLERIRGRKI
jgi:uncharacterized protein YjiS (DUF1127 family)